MNLRHGIDLVEIERIRHVLQRQQRSALHRLWAPDELEDVLGFDPTAEGETEAPPEDADDAAPADTWSDRLTPAKIASLAARFAAREAAVKALGTGFSEGIGLEDIKVLRDGRGAPKLYLKGAARKRAAELGVRDMALSISHEGGYALASVVMLCEETDGL